MLFASPIQRGVLLNHGEPSWLLWSTAAMLGVLLLRSIQTFFQVEGRFDAYGKMELLHIVLKFAGVGTAMIAGYASPVLVLALFAIAPLSVVALFFAFSKERFFDGRGLLHNSTAKELFQYAKWFLITNSVSAVIVYMPNFVLTGFGDMREVGVYSAAQTLASIFPMLGAYIAILLSPRIMTYCRQGKFYALYRLSQTFLFGAACVVYLFLVFCFDWIAAKLLPPGYATSQHMFMILLPAALSWLMTMPLNTAFLLFVRPKFIFFVESATFPFLLLSYFMVIPGSGAIGAAWVTTVFGLTRSIIIQVAAWRWALQTKAGTAGELSSRDNRMLVMDLTKGSGL
jgi:O-antigen/teichoic acid export membrane protein